MLLILVVMKSFSGNLMSLLAVRHIPQPFQSITDVLDDASITMIWEANSAYVQYYRVIIIFFFRFRLLVTLLLTDNDSYKLLNISLLFINGFFFLCVRVHQYTLFKFTFFVAWCEAPQTSFTGRSILECVKKCSGYSCVDPFKRNLPVYCPVPFFIFVKQVIRRFEVVPKFLMNLQ